MLRWLARQLGRGAPAPDVAAIVREALAAQTAGRHEEAERAFYRALALRPDSAEVQFLLGELFRLQGRLDAALQSCEAGVRLAPDFAPGRNNLGTALRELGRLGEAEEAYRRAIALDATLAEAHYNLGIVLVKQRRIEEAAAAFRAAARTRPGFSYAHLNLGYALEEAGDHEGAIAAYRQASRAEPGLVEAHVNLGMQLLLTGRYEEGWREYEWRRRYPEYGSGPAGAVRWNGQPLPGRTLLLDGEQGFGDAIQFVRYAREIAAGGGRVIVRCAPEVQRLLGMAPYVASAVPAGSEPPAFDFWCPLPSLPLAFGTVAETVPAKVPYLRADPSESAPWAARVRAGGVFAVGVVWASQSGHRTASDKSLPLAALGPLAAVPGVRLVSLQKGAASEEARTSPPPGDFIDLARELRDFADTAALVEALDLVVSVDTAVAHLAGAMGKPAWTLLKAAPDWRWGLGRPDSPWYPSMRLFRQARAGDWTSPVGEAAAALRELVAISRRAY